MNCGNLAAFMEAIMAKKQSGDKPSTLAAKVLSGQIKHPTPSQAKVLAGSVLGQDEKKGKRGK
jgi:hypothetical protein